MTSTKLDYAWILTQGRLSQDMLHIGGLRVEKQTFEEATYWQTIYPSWWSPQDSSLGLARFRPNTSFSTVDSNGPLQNMIEQNSLDRNVFALKLPRTDEELGELVLGGSDERYSHSLLTLPLTNVTGGNSVAFLFYASSGWQVSISAMSFGATSKSKSSLNISLDGYTAIISNSFGYISVPRDIGIQILPHLDVDDEVVDLPCDQRAELPDLTISFGDHGALVLTPWHYLVEVEDFYRGTRCVVPISGRLHYNEDEHSPDWIMLGAAFLSSLYSVFDTDNETISREYLAHCFA
jgi:hypothetical protein